MSDTVSITNSEWCVMRIVWTLKQCTSRQIIDEMTAKNDWSPSTTKTLITRLKNKDYLNADKHGGSFTYSPKISERDAMNAVSVDLFSNMCEMKVGKEVGTIIDHFDISKNDIQMLIDKLTEKQKTAPDQVKCNCVDDQYMKCGDDMK
ncbi:CopY/TcrY family copper transport repressor [Nicoliella spurrieriana]|uniref:CopY/TcrY family copper transport repressor n=1 Tax=Nicoliella spurrieriana TaxID=2925830 RepID=A0A976X6C0_9LACO|nr:CopY/TcrY family copper transport repressor [Nicoliella spurrieriana]UQS87331.1 CopY/TcrY family copper transport repressor [Nicoliella spurrieriana]